MIERKAVRNATTTIVSDEIEPGKSEFIHHRYKFVRHRPLRIGVMILSGSGHTAAAIAAEIDANNCVVAREPRRHDGATSGWFGETHAP